MEIFQYVYISVLFQYRILPFYNGLKFSNEITNEWMN